MTRNKDQKRIIRNRMKKTGESYTAARAQILSRTKSKPKAEPEPEYAAIAGMSDEKVRQATGRTWREWTKVLDEMDASAMKHRDIAQLVHEKYGVREWWTQTVTVGYERIKGLRDRGQRRGGGYEVTKSRTYNVPVDVLFNAWADDAIRREWIGGVKAHVRKATRAKSVRLQWPDGTIVVAMFMSKGPERSAVAVTQTKLATRAAADVAKREWTARLATMAEAITGAGV